jgi:hypothetical protein
VLLVADPAGFARRASVFVAAASAQREGREDR